MKIRHELILRADADDLGNALTTLEAHFSIDEFHWGNANQGRETRLDQEGVIVGQALCKAAFGLLALFAGKLELLNPDVVGS